VGELSRLVSHRSKGPGDCSFVLIGETIKKLCRNRKITKKRKIQRHKHQICTHSVSSNLPLSNRLLLLRSYIVFRTNPFDRRIIFHISPLSVSFIYHLIHHFCVRSVFVICHTVIILKVHFLIKTIGAKWLCANVHLIFADAATGEQGSYLHFSLLAN